MLKINTQLRSPVRDHNGSELLVHSVFYTMQGEGPYSGVPAVFIRLAGCNLRCPGCDTEYTQGATEMRLADLVRLADLAFPKRSMSYLRPPLFVITGGEPFRQNISPLCECLLQLGAIVQIETNGTLPPSPELPGAVRVVCSPKAPKINKELAAVVFAYKYVVQAKYVATDGLPTAILGKQQLPARPHHGFTGCVYLTPMDEQNPKANEANCKAAVESCITHGYAFNLQLHKYINKP